MALAGYNPNTSLLPSGGGPIQPMSGGGMGPPPGFNASQTMLPQASGAINPFSGGFMNEPIQLIPNNSPSVSFIGGAAIPKGIKQTKITSDSIEVTWDNFDPAGKTYKAKALPPVPPPPVNGKEPEPVKATITGRIDYPNKLAIFEKLAPDTKYKIQLFAGTQQSLETPEFTTLSKSVSTGTDTSENATAITSTPENKKNIMLLLIQIVDKVKEIILFGTPVQLENPKQRKNDNFTPAQLTALEKFGLDGPGLSTKEKFDVIQALYDGKCNTDQPMIFLQNCEPIRRIVQSLALNLLEKIQTKNSDISAIKKEEQPSIEYSKTDDGGMKICLSFKPGQLGLLSKFAPKTPNTKKPITPSGGPSTGTNDKSIKPVTPTGTSSTNDKLIKPVTTTSESGSGTNDKSIKPDGLVSSDVGADTFKVTWTKLTNSSINPTYTATATADGKDIFASIVENTATFTGLTPGKKYSVVIIAKLDDKAEKSEPLDVTTNESGEASEEEEEEGGEEEEEEGGEEEGRRW